MNRAKWVVIGLVIIGAVAVLDLPYTVGLKSMVVGLLPISPERKAEIITNMCNRALPSPIGANWTCQGANIAAEWQQASSEKFERQRQKEAICAFFAQLAQKPIGTENDDWKLIGKTTEGATIVATSGDEKGKMYVVDYENKVISTASATFGLGVIECTDLKAPPL